VADVWPRCPVYLVTDGRCVFAEVSRVFGNQVRGVSVADVLPRCPVCLVTGVLPMCIGRSVPCVW